MTRMTGRKMSLTPQTLQCYPKAQIRQGADRIRARPAVGATPRRVRPGHDAQGCWARHDQLTNATLAAELGTTNCYLARAAMQHGRRGTVSADCNWPCARVKPAIRAPLAPASVRLSFWNQSLRPGLFCLGGTSRRHDGPSSPAHRRTGLFLAPKQIPSVPRNVCAFHRPASYLHSLGVSVS